MDVLLLLVFQSNSSLSCSQSQLHTSGFYTSRPFIEKKESQEIDLHNGSPTQGQIEEDQASTVNNTTAAAHVPVISVMPLLPGVVSFNVDGRST